MADNESAQTYGPPECMAQHVINQALVLKDVALALSSVRALKNRRGRKTFYYSHSVFKFGNLTYLFFSLCHSIIHLSVSLYVCLSVSLALSFSHNCVWTRGEFFHRAGSNGGTENERQGEQAMGRLGRRPLLFSLCLPLTLSAVAQS